MTSFNALFKGPVTFEKWHGAQNDFLFAEAESFFSSLTVAPDSASVAAAAEVLCHRHCGLGADGLVLWQSDNSGKISAGIWNSDGTRAGTCGNALRCLAALLFEKKVWNGRQAIDVLEIAAEGPSADKKQPNAFATLLSCDLLQGAKNQFSARVGMGELQNIAPVDRSGFLQLCESENALIAERLRAALSAVAFVRLANPHLVLILESEKFSSFSHDDFIQVGRLLQSSRMCEALKIPVSNIGFVEIADGNGRNAQDQRLLNGIVFERGAGLTPCCGSGGCAMKVALENSKLSRTDEVERIAMPGGVIEIRTEGKSLELTGPAQRFCRIEIS